MSFKKLPTKVSSTGVTAVSSNPFDLDIKFLHAYLSKLNETINIATIYRTFFHFRQSTKYVIEDGNIYFIIFSKALVFRVKGQHKGFRVNDRYAAIFK